MLKRLWLAAAVAVAGCASDSISGSNEGGQRFSAEIRRTAYGVPHIKAEDFGGIGYGFGYASAADNICEILDRYLTVTASRARYLGAGAGEANIASDLYHQRMIQSGDVEKLLSGPRSSPDTPSSDARALAAGYVAGVNRYIREHGAAIQDPRCKGQPWVKEIREIDFWRHMFVGQTIDSLIAPTTSAAPPTMIRQALAEDPEFDTFEIGSNAYGLGKEVTKNGRGMLLSNPHYPWDGPNRFYRSHFTIPDKLNVVGVSYIGMPLIRMGHTDRIAWTNTVSTARRFGYYELTLDPNDPTAYMYEGKSTPMQRTDVTVQVKDAAPVTRTLYSTRYGPVVSSETFPWSRERAFALRTVQVGLRDVDQYMSVWQSSDVRDMRRRLTKYQSYRFNTTAADLNGEAFFGDTGLIPNVTPELAAECAISDLAKEQWARNRLPVLDGSRAACEWQTDDDSTQPGVFGPENSPHLFRTDYVTQSNDSYWLTNPKQPITGLSPIWGDEATARSLRTRLGILQVEQRVAGTDGLGPPKFDLKSLQQVMYGNRNLGAEMMRDDLVKACRASETARLQPACDALAKWDLRVDLDSRGAHLFQLIAQNLFLGGGPKWKVPFDPRNPVTTPNTLDTSDPNVLQALEKAVDRLAQLNIPLDARLRDVQVETRGTEPIPIHGGPGPLGVFNVISVDDASLTRDLGWTSIRHGASWIMTVEFTDAGPRSEGILTYSEATDPTSPHHSDQTRLYSQEGWDDLLFTDAAVEAATVSRIMLSE